MYNLVFKWELEGTRRRYYAVMKNGKQVGWAELNDFGSKGIDMGTVILLLNGLYPIHFESRKQLIEKIANFLSRKSEYEILNGCGNRFKKNKKYNGKDVIVAKTVYPIVKIIKDEEDNIDHFNIVGDVTVIDLYQEAYFDSEDGYPIVKVNIGGELVAEFPFELDGLVEFYLNKVFKYEWSFVFDD